MKLQPVVALILAGVPVSVASAQLTLNPSPSRSFGQPQLVVASSAPNLVEGRELNGPQGIALDLRANPPAVYVSDTLNNRVLGWRNAAGFSNGQKADLVIGQRDFFSTNRGGPGTSLVTGLTSPTGLLVDRSGNLYIADSGNNRVLRFPNPFSQTTQLPDLVIGQTSFNANQPNGGNAAPSASTMGLNIDGGVYRASLALDAAGNLYLADAGNHRVLRYRAADLGANPTPGPAADLVIGQPDFVTRQPAALTADARLGKGVLRAPSGLAIDATGRLYVSDGLARVLFYRVLQTGAPADRVLGVQILAPGQGTATAVNDTALASPEGLAMFGTGLAVADAPNNRVVFYDLPEQWPAETAAAPSPKMRAAAGQVDLFNNRANRGLAEPTAVTLASPLAMAFSGTELYVADTSNHRVIVLPQTGPAATGPGVRVLGQDGFDLNAPNLIEGRELRVSVPTDQGQTADAGIVIDQRGGVPRLYISDTYNNRVLGFRDARRVRPGSRADIVIGQPDFRRAVVNYPANDAARPSDSSLLFPIGLAVDVDGNLYVADSGNGRVLRFPRPLDLPDGAPQRADLVLGQSNFTTKIIDPTPRTMRAPFGLAFAADNGLLVSDTAHNRVLFFAGSAKAFTSGMAAALVFGQPDFTSSASGSDSNRFWEPRHLATDTDDRLYVADTRNNRVQIFNRAPAAGTDPRAAVTLRAVSAVDAPLSFPRGLFVSRDTGEVWIADTNNQRVLRYPKFDDLALSPLATAGFTVNSPIAVAQASTGDLYIADATNRVAFYYGGVAAINGANFLPGRALAPGTITALFALGNRFTDATVANSNLQVPLTLADTQVLVNDTPAPLYAVTPSQINFMVPFNAPTSGSADVVVLRPSTGQIVGAGSLPMDVASPALFTSAQSGTGQAAAINADGTVNGPSNPAARGQFISLYGTGQGFIQGAASDGSPATANPLLSTPDRPRVIIGTGFVSDDDIQFSGLAPNFVGLWQLNVRIPMTVAPSNNVLVVVQLRSINSNDPSNPARIRTTISVKQ